MMRLVALAAVLAFALTVAAALVVAPDYETRVLNDQLQLALVVAYVWVVALPFQAQGRYSLPAKAFLIIAAVAAVDLVLRRRRGDR